MPWYGTISIILQFQFFIGDFWRQIRTGTVNIRLRVGKDVVEVPVSLSAYGDLIGVRLEETQQWLGLLDYDTGKAVNRLLSQYSVRLVSFIPNDRRTDKHGFTRTDQSPTHQVHAIIYGISEELGAIGCMLSDEGIFLQHPTFIECYTAYENPHYLRRPGTDIEIPAALGSNSHAKNVNLTTDKLEQLFESAQGPQTFSEVRVSPRLRSALKRYVAVRVALRLVCRS